MVSDANARRDLERARERAASVKRDRKELGVPGESKDEPNPHATDAAVSAACSRASSRDGDVSPAVPDQLLVTRDG